MKMLCFFFASSNLMNPRRDQAERISLPESHLFPVWWSLSLGFILIIARAGKFFLPRSSPWPPPTHHHHPHFARVIVDGCCSKINKLRGAIDCPFCECGSQTGLFLFLFFAGGCVKGDDPSFEKGKLSFTDGKSILDAALFFLSASIDSSSLVLILLKTKIISKH